MENSNRTVIALEQCCICSGHYEQGRRAFAQPDVNRLVMKLLDVKPALAADGSSYLNHYMPVCMDCIRKVKKYDRMRLELEVLRREVISSIVDTLVHIRPTEETPLQPVKDQIVNKWVTKEGQVCLEPQQTQQPLTAPPESSTTVPIASSPVRIDRPRPRPRITAPRSIKPRIIRSPPKTAEELLHRQHSFGRKLNNSNTYSIKPAVSTSTMNTFSAVNNQNSASWVNEVSIVADNEIEAQEILAAYVAANIEQGEGGEVEVVQPQIHEGFELPDPDDSYFETADGDSVYSVDENDKEAESKEKTNDHKSPKPKRKHVATNLDPNRPKRRPPIKYEKVPQHERPPFFCENCGRVYIKLGTLRIHAQTCQGPDESEKDKPINCSMCSTSFDNWLGLKFHIDELHPECHIDKCRFCKKDFLPNTFLNHKCVDRLEKLPEEGLLEAFNCSFCDKVYYKMTSLNEHFRRHHSHEERFRCEICKRDFSAQIVLDRHFKTHTVGTKSPHICQTCGISCTTVWGLREHEKLHTGERPYKCEVCGKTFRLHNIKKNHMVTHTGERNFACELCGNTFTLYATMLRHWKKCRNPVQGPKRGKWCPICLSEGILYQKLKSLKEHMIRKHPGTKEAFEICREIGNREFGFEIQDEEEMKKLRSIRPTPKARVRVKTDPDANYDSHKKVIVQKKTKVGKDMSPARRSIRKRKPTKRMGDQDFLDPNKVDSSDDEAETILPDDGIQSESDVEHESAAQVKASSVKKRKVDVKTKAGVGASGKKSLVWESSDEDEEESEAEIESPKRTTSMNTRHQGLKKTKVNIEPYVNWINEDKNRKK